MQDADSSTISVVVVGGFLALLLLAVGGTWFTLRSRAAAMARRAEAEAVQAQRMALVEAQGSEAARHELVPASGYTVLRPNGDWLLIDAAGDWLFVHAEAAIFGIDRPVPVVEAEQLRLPGPPEGTVPRFPAAGIHVVNGAALEQRPTAAGAPAFADLPTRVLGAPWTIREAFDRVTSNTSPRAK